MNRALAKTNTISEVQKLLVKNQRAIKSVLPRHITPERISRVALGSLRKNQKLQQCDAQSIMQCILVAATLGLEVDDGTGRCYLVPYKNKSGGMTCQIIIGYRGLLELAYRSGELLSVSVREVYESDQFEIVYGLYEKLEHIPSGETDPAKITHVYCVIRYKSGGHHIEVMTRSQVEAIRDRSSAGRSGPWQTDFAMMARKTVLRRALRYAPISTDVSRAVTVDEASERGEVATFDLDTGEVFDSKVEEQPLTVDDVVQTKEE
jgi:recombination protein RecT